MSRLWSGAKWIGLWAAGLLRTLGRFLSKTDMPIWLSVILAVAAAVGTYIYAPKINQQFEYQKNRSQHVLGTLNELNRSMVDLSVSIRKFNESVFYSRNDIAQKRGETLDDIAEMQWRLIDSSVILHRSGVNGSSLRELRDRLSNLRAAVIEAQRPADQETVIAAHEQVATAARAAAIALYTAANLR